MKTSRFDNIIHAPNRLQICAFLVQLDEAEFQLLRDELAGINIHEQFFLIL